MLSLSGPEGPKPTSPAHTELPTSPMKYRSYKSTRKHNEKIDCLHLVQLLTLIEYFQRSFRNVTKAILTGCKVAPCRRSAKTSAPTDNHNRGRRDTPYRSLGQTLYGNETQNSNQTEFQLQVELKQFTEVILLYL